MPPSRPYPRFASWLRTAGVLALTVTGLTCRDASSLAPGLPNQVSLAIAPQLQRAASSGGPSFVSLNKVLGTLTPVGGGKTYAIEAPFIRDTAVLSFDVTFAGASQQYTLALAATDTAGDTLFKSTRDIVATPGTNAPLQDLLRYVAPDTAVRFLSVGLSDTALVGGDSLSLTAVGYDGSERRITPLYIGWTSRDSLVARVSSRGPSVARIFGGTFESDVWIVGRAFNGATDSVLVPVRLPVGSVVLNADTLRLVTGQLATLGADVRSAAGATLDRPVSWRSLDTTVATVVGYVGGVARNLRVSSGASSLAFGQVLGIAAGAAKIVATSGGRSDTTIVVVAAVPVASISITPDTLALLVGQQARFSGVTLDASGTPLAGRTIVWVSSDTLVARVSTDGTVLGIGVGLATLTATSEGVVASASVRVVGVASAIARTVVSPGTVQLAALGDVVQLVVRSYAPDSTLVPGVYTYAVSGAPGVVTVDGFGRLTAIGVGTTRVVVTESGGTSDSAAVNVSQVPALVQLGPPVQLGLLGAIAVFHATVFDAGGAPIPSAPLTWTVKDASVAAIVSAAGDSLVVTAIGNGVTPIDAASGNAIGSTQLTVAQVAKSATLTPNALILGVDGRAKLTPVLRDGNGTPMPFAQKDLQWVIEGVPGIADVDSVGEVHARALGATGVYVIIQGIRSGTANINVSDAAPRAILFSVDTLTASPNGSRVFVFLTVSTPVPLVVTLSDPLGIVKFDKDTLVFDQGRTNRDLTITGLADGRTTVTASDGGKLFAPDSLTVFVGKATIPVIVGSIIAPARATSSPRRAIRQRSPARPRSP